jgi:hypothetical protein
VKTLLGYLSDAVTIGIFAVAITLIVVAIGYALMTIHWAIGATL